MYSTMLHTRQSHELFSSRLSARAVNPVFHFEVSPLSVFEDQLPLRLSFYEIIWFKSGQGRIWIDTQSYEQCTDMIYFMVPGQHRRFVMDGDMNGYRIQFSSEILCRSDFLPRLIQSMDPYSSTSAPAIPVDKDLQHEMEDILLKMQKEFSNYNLLRSEILAGLLSIILIHFSRRLQATPSAPSLAKDSQLVRNFLQLVQQHFIAKKLVTDYADALYVTPNYLNRTVKKVTGFTASHHIQQQIILEAKRRALHSNGSMKEIAYWLGFDNLAHFSKFFKNNSGVSFTQFRRGTQVTQ